MDGSSLGGSMTENITKRLQSFSYATPSLYGDMLTGTNPSGSIAAKLGLHMPNLAPDLEEELEPVEHVQPTVINAAPGSGVMFTMEEVSKEPKKKKYAKEAWPGKKPTHSYLM